MNKKQTIRLNEIQLKNIVTKIVSESVKMIIKENEVYDYDIQDYLVKNGRLGKQKNEDIFIWFIITSNKRFCSKKNFKTETEAMLDCTKYMDSVLNTEDIYMAYIIRYFVDDEGGIDESTVDYYNSSTHEWDD